MSIFVHVYKELWASQLALVVKNPTDNAGDVRAWGFTHGSGRSSGGGSGNPLQWQPTEVT